MCHLIETKFADVLERLQTIRNAHDSQGASPIEDLSDAIADIVKQVATELRDQDARLQHIEHHLRPDPRD